MTKKSFYQKIAIFLIAVVVIQISYTPWAFAMGGDEGNNLESFEQGTGQKGALDAYNAIIGKLKSGDLDEDIYAGAYIDETKLVVMLTDLTDEVKNGYLAVIEDPNVVDFKQAEFSLKYLHEQVDETVKMMGNCPITGYGVYESQNKGHIKIDKDYYDNFVSELSATYSDYDIPIIFEPGEYYDKGLAEGEMENESVLESVNNFEDYYSMTASTEIMGGMPITTSQGNSTTGFCGYYGIMDAIIIAGHAVSEGENTKYGKVVQRKYNNNQYGDYAIIFVDSNYKLTNTICNRHWDKLDVTTVYSNVPEGTQISAYGDITKGVYGVVDATNESRTSSRTGVTIRGLTSVICDVYGTRKGDSGGPVYVNLGNWKVAACGIIQGGDSDTEMCFVPFEHIASAFSPKTTP